MANFGSALAMQLPQLYSGAQYHSGTLGQFPSGSSEPGGSQLASSRQAPMGPQGYGQARNSGDSCAVLEPSFKALRFRLAAVGAVLGVV